MGVADWPNSSGIRLSLIPIFQDCRTSCNRSSPGSGPRQIDHAEGAIMVFRLAVHHRNRWVRTAGQPLFARPGDRPAAGALIRRDSASVGLVFRPLYTITSAIAGRGTGCERISPVRTAACRLLGPMAESNSCLTARVNAAVGLGWAIAWRLTKISRLRAIPSIPRRPRLPASAPSAAGRPLTRRSPPRLVETLATRFRPPSPWPPHDSGARFHWPGSDRLDQP